MFLLSYNMRCHIGLELLLLFVFNGGAVVHAGAIYYTPAAKPLFLTPVSSRDRNQFSIRRSCLSRPLKASIRILSIGLPVRLKSMPQPSLPSRSGHAPVYEQAPVLNAWHVFEVVINLKHFIRQFYEFSMQPVVIFSPSAGWCKKINGFSA